MVRKQTQVLEYNAYMILSITGQLFHLPEETVVIPGHGPLTTIAAEREDNPYVGKYA